MATDAIQRLFRNTAIRELGTDHERVPSALLFVDKSEDPADASCARRRQGLAYSKSCRVCDHGPCRWPD